MSGTPAPTLTEQERAAVRAHVAAAPPLTPAQLGDIADILRPVAEQLTRERITR